MVEEEETAYASYWERWTRERGPFYRSCAVVPLDSATEPTADNGDGIDRPEIVFTTGLPRLMLRNLPILLLGVLALYVPAATIGAVRKGRIGVSLPAFDTGTVALLLPVAVLGAVWIYVLYRFLTAVLDGSTAYRSVVFFLTAIPLTAGTVYTIYTSMTTGTIPPGPVVQAGYFLFVLVAGHLVYDGLVLRTENLLSELGKSDIVDAEAYEQFREERLSTLGSTIAIGPVTVSRSMAFTGVLSFIPLLMPIVTLNWNIWQILAFVPYSVATILVVAVAYDTFVLIYVFMALLQSDVLVYKPFHPDDHGGFRDLGRFATRVNTILAVTGGYVAYRFVVEGLYYFGNGGFESTMGTVTWGVSYVVPILAYVAFVLFWLYHSFWKLHRRMERGRRKRVEKCQREAREAQDTPPEEFTDPFVDAPAWEALKSAPTWPVNRQGLIGIVAIDMLPLLASFVL
jgi:uncharacterized membrane protein